MVAHLASSREYSAACSEVLLHVSTASRVSLVVAGASLAHEGRGRDWTTASGQQRDRDKPRLHTLNQYLGPRASGSVSWDSVHFARFNKAHFVFSARQPGCQHDGRVAAAAAAA